MTEWAEHFEETAPPATEDAIASARERVGSALPDDLASFYRATNGGVPKRRFVVGDHPDAETMLSYFLSLDGGPFPNALDYASELLSEGAIPSGMLPVAEDFGGAFVMVDCNQETFGSVYLMDPTVEPHEDGSETFTNMVPVAETFAKLVEGLGESSD